MDVDEFLRALDEPPEVMRSMTAYLRDRRSWDPATWDADQERAARAAVVETPAGRLVLGDPAARARGLRPDGCSRTGRRTSCRRSRAGIVVVRRTTPGDEDVDRRRRRPFRPAPRVVDVTAPGHNLLRYRPDEVTAAILGG